VQAILWRALANLPSGIEHVQGREGRARAQALGLAPIDDASSEYERWWGDTRRLVVEVELGNGYASPMTFVDM
jgi:hypothetical protein